MTKVITYSFPGTFPWIFKCMISSSRKLEEIVTKFTFNVFFFSILIPLPFASLCFQANSNEIVLASTHDVQEVDVSSLVAVQPYTWIGEDFDKESRRWDSGPFIGAISLSSGPQFQSSLLLYTHN